MRVVEKGGESLKGILQRSNPLIARQCQRTDCLVCITSGKGPCDGQGVTCQIVCEKCDSVYVEELSRSIRKRDATSYSGSLFGKDPGVGWSRDSQNLGFFK